MERMMQQKKRGGKTAGGWGRVEGVSAVRSEIPP